MLDLGPKPIETAKIHGGGRFKALIDAAFPRGRKPASLPMI